MESMQGHRRYDVNVDYFETWTPEMAYILGVLTSDGSSDGKTISLELANRDINLVMFVRDELCPQKSISFRDSVNSARIRIHSIVLCNSLNKLGVFPRKTGYEFLPQMEEKYFSHYLRGVFDGDGWVSTRRNSVECGIVSASYSFIHSLRSKLLNIGSIIEKTPKDNKKQLKLYAWQMYSRHAEKFRDIIYDNYSFALPRKYNKFYSNYKIICKRFWTKEQIEILQSNYIYKGDLVLLSSLIGKSYKSVSKKIYELNLAKNY